MEKGTLIAQVYTARTAIPIEDVAVTVMEDRTDEKRLIAYRVTDRDGRTQPVEIETPDIVLSQFPSEETPFATCNVQLDHPLYESVLVEHVQVFAETESIQPMEMIPLVEHSPKDEEFRVFEITPQNL